jgi:hypothetical protein
MTTVVLDGLSYVRVGRAVGISNIEVRQSMHLLGALGYCRPTAPFITALAELGDHLAEIAGRRTGAQQARHVATLAAEEHVGLRRLGRVARQMLGQGVDHNGG